MFLLPLRAYLTLFSFELRLKHGGFSSLYAKVHDCHVKVPTTDTKVIDRVCHAFDLASIWYWKEVLCLQRSAATAFLLRRVGVPAELVVGAQHTPFKAHAWVEVEGRVVNDKPYMREIYRVLDRRV